MARRSRRTSHHVHRARRSWEDTSGVGARARNRGGGLHPRGVRAVGRHSGSRVRRIGDRRGSRTRGRHRVHPAEARTRRVRRPAHVAGPRQLRARSRGGAARRGSPDIGHVTSLARHQPRAAPLARRTGIRRRTSRITRGLRRALPGRSRAGSSRPSLRGTGSRRAARFSPHVIERPHRDGDLSAARCTARSRSSWRPRGSKC